MPADRPDRLRTPDRRTRSPRSAEAGPAEAGSAGAGSARRRTGRGRTALAAAVSLAAAGALLAGCAAASGTGARPSRLSEEGPLRASTGTTDTTGATGSTADGAGRAGRDAPQTLRTAPAPATPAAGVLPGVGPKTLSQVPADAQQVVLVTGTGHDAPTSEVQLFDRDPGTGWTAAGPVWPAHNALRGWSADHHAGDLRSPIGVFTLTDAGGRLADPGTRLSYDHAPIGFGSPGTGFHGESLAGAFDYVIAINYNRKPGTTPLDWTRPLGGSRGGGIWLHVDHGGPTHGCVSLPQPVMRTLLRTLTPARHPVVVMGDAKALAG